MRAATHESLIALHVLYQIFPVCEIMITNLTEAILSVLFATIHMERLFTLIFLYQFIIYVHHLRQRFHESIW